MFKLTKLMMLIVIVDIMYLMRTLNK